MPPRRQLIAAGLAGLVAAPLRALAATPLSIWRDPNCGYCTGWVDHLRAEGFAVQD